MYIVLIKHAGVGGPAEQLYFNKAEDAHETANSILRCETYPAIGGDDFGNTIYLLQPPVSVSVSDLHGCARIEVIRQKALKEAGYDA